jgi:hypothetical protein
VRVYLVIHPRSREVEASAAEFTDNPDWPRRELDVPDREWPEDGKPDPRLARDWWDRSRPDDAPMWPLLP